LWSQGQLTDFVQNMLMHLALSTIEWEVDTRKRIWQVQIPYSCGQLDNPETYWTELATESNDATEQNLLFFFFFFSSFCFAENPGGILVMLVVIQFHKVTLSLGPSLTL
jgi:hypothetical protein